MLAPPSDELDDARREAGFWVELRDAKATVVYRQVMRSPIRSDVEIFSDDPKQTIGRVPVDRPAGVFIVVVPLLRAADEVALMSSQPSTFRQADGRDPDAVTGELLRVRLDRSDEQPGETTP